jgi:hypothetical protein
MTSKSALDPSLSAKDTLRTVNRVRSASSDATETTGFSRCSLRHRELPRFCRTIGER